jgi:hypothetical protein
MYEFECLTVASAKTSMQSDDCRPFSGECYPDVEGVCGPECSPME